ncbi:MAG: glycosyltransferase [Patescibacteria group bacterium]
MFKVVKLESGDQVIASWDVIGHLAGWIDILFEKSRELKDCGILSALILNHENKVYFHGGYIAPNLMLPISYAAGQEFFGQYPGTREVEMVPLLLCIVKKELIDKLPLIECAGDCIFKDAEYCLKAQELGFGVYTTDELIVQYRGKGHALKNKKEFARQFKLNHQFFKNKFGPKYKEKYKNPVVYHTGVESPTGFAIAAKNYIAALLRANTKVYYSHLSSVPEAEPLTDDGLVNDAREEVPSMDLPQIIWGQAPLFFKNSGKYKIGHCEFEGSTIPDSWVPYANMMDEVWTPTLWDKKKLQDAGVKVPIYTIPQGIDPNYFHPNMAPVKIDAKEKFKFICNATWEPRKNLAELVKAFTSEFKRSEDVCLIIKTLSSALSQPVKKEVQAIKAPREGARVYVKEEILTPEQIGCFYTMGDCFVLPTHGEGWGLPLLEALASGIPIITTGYGAPNEVLRNDKGESLPGVHFVDWVEGEAKTPYIYLDGNRWAMPKIDDLKAKMRFVFENHQEEKKKAMLTSKYIREKFSWDACVVPITKRLEKIYENN